MRRDERAAAVVFFFFFTTSNPGSLAAAEAGLLCSHRLITWQDVENCAGNGSSGAGVRHQLPYNFNECF